MDGEKALETGSNVTGKANAGEEKVRLGGSHPAKVVLSKKDKVGNVGNMGNMGNVGNVGSHPAKVVVGKEEVGWGQMLRVTLHTTTKYIAIYQSTP